MGHKDRGVFRGLRILVQTHEMNAFLLQKLKTVDEMRPNSTQILEI